MRRCLFTVIQMVFLGATLAAQIDWSTCIPTPHQVINKEIAYRAILVWDTTALSSVDSSKADVMLNVGAFIGLSVKELSETVFIDDIASLSLESTITELEPIYAIHTNINTTKHGIYYCRLNGINSKGKSFTAIAKIDYAKKLNIIPIENDSNKIETNKAVTIVRTFDFLQLQTAMSTDQKPDSDTEASFQDCSVKHLDGLKDLECVLDHAQKVNEK